MSEPLYIGIDAGGSAVEIMTLGGGTSTACSPTFLHVAPSGTAPHADALAALIAENIAPSEHARVGGVCIGVPSTRAFPNESFAHRLRESLGPAFASCALVVEDHALLALDANFGETSGMAIVVGTTSTVVAQTEEGSVLRAGAWGFRAGDDGSAVAIGTDALQAIAADFDGGEPTVLRPQFGERYGDDSPATLADRVHAHDWNVDSLVPLVTAAAEAGDWVSTRILKTQANALAQRAGWIATRAPTPITPRVVLLGHLAEEGYYRACLAEALVRHLPSWRVLRSARRPVHGALARAQRCALAADSGN